MPLTKSSDMPAPRFSSFVLIPLVAVIVIFGGAISLFTGSAAGPGTTQGYLSDSARTTPSDRHDLAKTYGNLPLSFARNSGQANERVRFSARGLGYGLFLSSDEAVLVLRPSAPSRDARERNELADKG